MSSRGSDATGVEPAMVTSLIQTRLRAAGANAGARSNTSCEPAIRIELERAGPTAGASR